MPKSAEKCQKKAGFHSIGEFLNIQLLIREKLFIKKKTLLFPGSQLETALIVKNLDFYHFINLPHPPSLFCKVCTVPCAYLGRRSGLFPAILMFLPGDGEGARPGPAPPGRPGRPPGRPGRPAGPPGRPPRPGAGRSAGSSHLGREGMETADRGSRDTDSSGGGQIGPG